MRAYDDQPNAKPARRQRRARSPKPEARGPRLENCIDDAPIPIDLPGLNAVEVIGLQEVLGRHAQHLRRLGDRWLHFAFFVGAARLQHDFLAVPLPRETESRVRESKDWILKLRGL